MEVGEMLLKKIAFKALLKLLIYLKRDFDYSQRRLKFMEVSRMDVGEMDRDMLGQLIRFHSHALDKATKCENTAEGRGDERRGIVEKAIAEWEKRGYPMGPDKVWAKKILKNFDLWAKGSAKLIEPAAEMHASDTDLFSAMESRRSVRFWKNRPVEREKIKRIIRAATQAPSSCNRMTWRFFVVENDLSKVVEGNGTNPSLLEKAPVRIYIGIDERLYPEIYAPGIDAGCALENLVLAAHAIGLGACMMYQCESINQEKLRSELNIPEHYRIYCAVVLGYPDEAPLAPTRVAVEEVTTFVGDEAKGSSGADCYVK
jgi:nitroreductase